jgi:hypothetical protein
MDHLNDFVFYTLNKPGFSIVNSFKTELCERGIQCSQLEASEVIFFQSRFPQRYLFWMESLVFQFLFYNHYASVANHILYV